MIKVTVQVSPKKETYSLIIQLQQQQMLLLTKPLHPQPLMVQTPLLMDLTMEILILPLEMILLLIMEQIQLIMEIVRIIVPGTIMAQTVLIMELTEMKLLLTQLLTKPKK